jgi:DNA-3-methyladenine glycosylase
MTGRGLDMADRGGPGRLAAALRIDRSLDGLDLCRVRIGISRDTHRLLRFWLCDSAFVSGPKSLNEAGTGAHR